MSGLSFNPVDVGVVLIILLSGALAYWRGFLREVLSIIAWVGAVLLTLQLLPLARPFAREHIPMDLLADSVAAAAIFIVSLVVLSIISSMIAGRVRDSGLNALDRSLGVLFGLLRGAVVVSLAYLAILLLYQGRDLPKSVATAHVTPAVHAGARVLLYLVPEELSVESFSILTTIETVETKGLTGRPDKSDADSEVETGYKSNARKDLDRLIRRTQK